MVPTLSKAIWHQSSWLSHEIKKMLAAWKKGYDKPRQHIKKQRHYFADKGPSSQSYGFSSSHIWMWELDCKESWSLKNWCFWTVVLEKTLQSPLDGKEIQKVHFLQDGLVISLQSKGLSRVFSNTTVQKHQFFGTQLYPSHPYMTTGKYKTTGIYQNKEMRTINAI